MVDGLIGIPVQPITPAVKKRHYVRNKSTKTILADEKSIATIQRNHEKLQVQYLQQGCLLNIAPLRKTIDVNGLKFTSYLSQGKSRKSLGCVLSLTNPFQVFLYP